MPIGAPAGAGKVLPILRKGPAISTSHTKKPSPSHCHRRCRIYCRTTDPKLTDFTFVSYWACRCRPALLCQTARDLRRTSPSDDPTAAQQLRHGNRARVLRVSQVSSSTSLTPNGVRDPCWRCIVAHQPPRLLGGNSVRVSAVSVSTTRQQQDSCSPRFEAHQGMCHLPATPVVGGSDHAGVTVDLDDITTLSSRCSTQSRRAVRTFQSELHSYGPKKP